MAPLNMNGPYHFTEKEKLKNKIHPDRPTGINWKYLCCDKFGQ